MVLLCALLTGCVTWCRSAVNCFTYWMCDVMQECRELLYLLDVWRDAGVPWMLRVELWQHLPACLLVRIHRSTVEPPLATSQTWCWSGGSGILTGLSLHYNIVYYYNGAQRYEQFLHVCRLYRALIWLDLALCLPCTSVCGFDCAMYILKFFCYIFLFTF